MLTRIWKPLLIAGVVMLIGAELILRFGMGFGEPPLVERDEEIEYMLKPSAEYRRFGNRVSVNAQRMRSDELLAEKAPDERRIVLVGDSVVYGNHWLDQSETIAAVLQGKLNADANGCRFTVSALAASSWGPVNQRAFIRRFGLYEADAVIVLASSHDQSDYPTFNSDLIPYRRNAALLAVTDAAQYVLERLMRKPEVWDKSLPYETRQKRSIGAFNDIFDLIGQSGAKGFFAFHPTTTELRGTAKAVSIYGEIAASKNAPFLDLTLAYQADGAALYRDAIHPSPAGAAVIAGELHKLLQEQSAADCIATVN